MQTVSIKQVACSLAVMAWRMLFNQLMKTGIPVWQERVSPVFDAAGSLLVIEHEGGREIGRQRMALPQVGMRERVVRLQELGVRTLVCGALSRPLEQGLRAAGIEVVPLVCGGAEEVLAAFLEGRLVQEQFAMPGCCGYRRRARRGRCRGAGFSRDSVC